MFNRMRSNDVPEAGVVIASGGNAGIAVAVAAKALGRALRSVRARVVEPGQAGPADRARGRAQRRRRELRRRAGRSLARQAESGALLMHAYDQREVVVGAGTLAAEVEDDAGVPDRALVSVGGGGLIAGIAAWFAADARSTRSSPSLRRRCSACSRRRRGRSTSRSAASPPIRSARAASARSPGSSRSTTCEAAHLLSDAAIRAAQLALWNELRLAVEPAAALPLAALRAAPSCRDRTSASCW